ncbi:MAG: hypothetical protein PWQ60_2375, partial [Thermoanaerobacteraceae bacterium]|nr:hypothetical protein [Thermoanaerobacteraceae bacterium]
MVNRSPKDMQYIQKYTVLIA